MDNKPDPSAFMVNERAGEFEATFRVRGTVSVRIQAESREDAERKAMALSEADDFGLELDEVDSIDLDDVWKRPRMFYVMRDGRPMMVSRLIPGDLPRQPDQRGY